MAVAVALLACARETWTGGIVPGSGPEPDRPAPTLDRVEPDHITASGEPVPLRVFGSLFGDDLQVTLDGVGVVTRYVAPDELAAEVPRAQRGGAHTISIRRYETLGVPFSVDNAVPTVSKIAIADVAPSWQYAPPTNQVDLRIEGTGFTADSVAELPAGALMTPGQDWTQMVARLDSKTVVFGSCQVTVTNPAPGGGRSNVLACAGVGGSWSSDVMVVAAAFDAARRRLYLGRPSTLGPGSQPGLSAIDMTTGALAQVSAIPPPAILSMTGATLIAFSPTRDGDAIGSVYAIDGASGAPTELLSGYLVYELAGDPSHDLRYAILGAGYDLEIHDGSALVARAPCARCTGSRTLAFDPTGSRVCVAASSEVLCFRLSGRTLVQEPSYSTNLPFDTGRPELALSADRVYLSSGEVLDHDGRVLWRYPTHGAVAVDVARGRLYMNSGSTIVAPPPPPNVIWIYALGENRLIASVPNACKYQGIVLAGDHLVLGPQFERGAFCVMRVPEPAQAKRQ